MARKYSNSGSSTPSIQIESSRRQFPNTPSLSCPCPSIRNMKSVGPMRAHGNLAIGTGAVLAAFITAAAAQDRPSYDNFNEGRFLRFLNAHEDEIDAVPRIGLSFGDR